MATFLTVDDLRANVTNAVPPVTPGAASYHAWPRPMPRSRLVLSARWRILPEGGLTCHWQTKLSAPIGRPPD